MWQWNTISVQAAAAAAATGCSQSNRLRLREYYAHITSESQTHWQTEARQARLMKSEEKKAGAIELERYTPISPFCITCFCTIRPHRQGHFMAWKRGIDEFIWVNKKKKKGWGGGECEKFRDTSDSCYALLDPTHKGTWTKETQYSDQRPVRGSRHMRNLSVILFSCILMRIPPFSFLPPPQTSKYLMKRAQTDAI